jgi:hypothetical protein
MILHWRIKGVLWPYVCTPDVSIMQSGNQRLVLG